MRLIVALVLAALARRMDESAHPREGGAVGCRGNRKARVPHQGRSSDFGARLVMGHQDAGVEFVQARRRSDICSRVQGLRRKRARNQKNCKPVSHAPSMAEGWLTARERAWLAGVKLCG